MTHLKHKLPVLGCSVLLSVLSLVAGSGKAAAFTLVNNLTIPGEAKDLAPGSSPNQNRLGGFFSDLYYDRYSNVYYGLVDRGPGGGLINYNTRVQKFSLDVDSTTGAISGFKLLDTILFTNNGANYNGLNPGLLNGNKSVLGQSLDPEGFAVAPNGNFYVSDEYGPSVYEFTPQGQFVRAFATPANLLPREASGTLNFVDGRPTITTGRQDNRGFEGLAISPDGSKLFAMLQDPLVNEGNGNDGRTSQNIRIVQFDTATGQSTAQYIYQLENLANINDRVPGTANDFAATAQGRNIGISAIVAVNDNEFLVLERDNRGIGVDNPAGSVPVGTKRIYKIDLTGATDVSNISLAGTSTLPAGITPVGKTLFGDIAALLTSAGQSIPEKFEGLTVGPQLTSGGFALILGTDNDFSVTQTGSGDQLDVCTDGTQVRIGSGCLAGSTLIPTFLYSFKVGASELGNYVPPTSAAVPEPTTMTGVALAGLASFWMKRRQRQRG